MCTKLHIYNIPNPCLNQQHYDEQRNVNIKRVRSTPFDTNNFLQSDSKARANLTRFMTNTYIQFLQKKTRRTRQTKVRGSILTTLFMFIENYNCPRLKRVEGCS